MTQYTRVLGLDMGTKTIGVAVSDALGWTARPVRTIQRKSWAEDLTQLQTLKTELGITQLVAGLPLGSDGEMTEQAHYCQRGAERIQQELDLPLAFVDESYSSQDAKSLLIEMGVGTKKRRQKGKQSLDELAATRILQDYLDQEHHKQRSAAAQRTQE